MKHKHLFSKKPLSQSGKNVYVFLGLTLLTALTLLIYALRIAEEPFAFEPFLICISVFLPVCAAIYAMPLLVDAYDFLLPIIGTAFMVLLLICSTPVQWRIIAENTPNNWDTAFNILVILGIALVISFFYMILGGLSSADNRKSGLPPYFSNISSKTKEMVTIVLASVLLLTGVTTSVIRQILLHERESYMVSCEDYTSLRNFKIAANTSTPEQVHTSLFDTDEYAIIEGIDHHDFLQFTRKEFVLLGVDISDPMLLQSKHLSMDFPKEAPIASIHVASQSSDGEENEIILDLDEELSQQIIQVVRGNTVALPQVSDTSKLKGNPFPDLGKYPYVKVYFEGYDAFYWQAILGTYEGMFALGMYEVVESQGDIDATEIKFIYYVLPVSK